jgi:transcription initiation factor TFIIB
MIVKELDLKMPVVDSVSCISRIASQIGLSEKTKRHAMKLLKKAEQNQIISGKDPMGMAASALYIASMETGENTTQKTIALAAGVTEVTIRNRCKNLKSLDA